MNNEVMTLGIFAHANAGKTTLTEQLLFHTNMKKNIGRVDYGNTTTDNMNVERERGISVKASMVTLPLNDRIVQLIDTPGHIDFSAEVERAINVLDGAVLVVSGVEGVEPQTQTVWEILKEKNIPTLIFINKMDRMGANYKKTLEELQSKLSNNIIPLIEVEKNDDTNDLSYKENKIDLFVEELSNVDDEILNKYLNEEKISPLWLSEKAKELSKNGLISFVYGGSALLDEGVLKFIDGIEKYLPIAEHKRNNVFSGYVYNVRRDSGVRELYVKVLDGELHNRQTFEDEFNNKQRIKTLSKIVGDKKIKCEVLDTGEIGIITGLNARVGDILGNKNIVFKPTTFVNPLFHANVNIQDSSKLSNLINALEILNDEDPELNLQYNKDINEISVDLMGPLQIEILKEQLSERFNLDALFSDEIIIHKETVSDIAEGSATYDRVSAVKFKSEPLKRGAGLLYESQVSTDYLFAKYQKQIERLIYNYVKQGLYGWELTDTKITLIDGKSDSVCSDPSHYNAIVPIALFRALKQSAIKLLEPIMSYEISIPKEYFKQTLSALMIDGIDYENITIRNNVYIIPGCSFLSQLVDLPIMIARLTSGHGSIIMKPYGFDLRKDNNVVEKKYIGLDPRNETLFLMGLNSSMDHIDRPSKKR